MESITHNRILKIKKNQMLYNVWANNIQIDSFLQSQQAAVKMV